MGNSEVAHLNIGAGRVVKGNLLGIAEAIADNRILDAPALSAMINRLQQSGGTCHLLELACTERHDLRPLLRDGSRQRWDRVAKAYAAIAEAEGPHFDTAQAAIAESYPRNVSDEFVAPSIIGGYRGMKDGDGVLCFNFRADRVRENSYGAL